MSELELFQAISNEDVIQVKSLLTAGVNPNSSSGGWTPLCMAAENGHSDIVSVLISSGANVNQIMNNGRTPINCAACKGHIDIVLALISAGAKINQADNDGRTPMYFAARYGHADVVSALMSAGANINQVDNNGTTPLIIAKRYGQDEVALMLQSVPIFRAAQYGDKKGLRTLLRSGLDPDSVRNKDGYTPLFVAAESGQHEAIEVLIEAGAKVDQTLNDGTTPLYIAAENDCSDAVSALIAARADILQTKPNGATPLCIAAEKGHLEVVRRLTRDLYEGSRNGLINIFASAFGDKKNNSSTVTLMRMSIDQAMIDGNAPLHLAAANSHLEVLQQLILAGANINQPNKNGWTPLFIAASNGDIAILAALISAGANMNLTANDGTTILHVATQFQHNNVVEYLTTNKMNCNISSESGETALYIAAKNGFIDIVWILLLAKADPDIQTKNGMTPLMIARNNQFDEVASLLAPEGLLKVRIVAAIQQGNMNQLRSLMTQINDPNIVAMDGNGPLHIAIKYNQAQALQMLLQISAIQRDSLNAFNETPLTLAIKAGSQFAYDIFAAIDEPIQYIEETELEINLNKELGSGGFGAVYQGKYKNQVVAVKKIEVNSNFTPSMLEREINAMQQCRSPFVLRLIAVCASKNLLNTTEPKLILEYMDDGDLKNHLYKKKNGISTKTNYSTLEIAWVISKGLADIHHNRCIHRDLKSQNILLSTEHYIKIADFGLTRNIYNTKTQGVGTISWTAPEVLTGRHYDSSADIYSFGVILTELNTLNLPYHDLSAPQHQMLNDICEGSLRPSVSSSCRTWYKKLVDDCLAQNPKKRPTANAIVNLLRDQMLKKKSQRKSRASKVSRQTSATSLELSASLSSSGFKEPFKSMPRSKASLALSNLEIYCKNCKEPNSIIHESCQYCFTILLKAEAKINILVTRLERANIKPMWCCLVCDEKNEMKLTECATCDTESDDLEKIHDLFTLLQQASAP